MPDTCITLRPNIADELITTLLWMSYILNSHMLNLKTIEHMLTAKTWPGSRRWNKKISYKDQRELISEFPTETGLAVFSQTSFDTMSKYITAPPLCSSCQGDQKTSMDYIVWSPYKGNMNFRKLFNGKWLSRFPKPAKPDFFSSPDRRMEPLLHSCCRDDKKNI